MTASNMVEIPRDLLARLIAALETPKDLSGEDLEMLIEDAHAWTEGS